MCVCVCVCVYRVRGFRVQGFFFLRAHAQARARFMVVGLV